MATTSPKQYRAYSETHEAIKALQEKTGMGSADILKAWQSAYEKVGDGEQGKDFAKARIEAVQSHFVAVIAELEAMARDLQAHHESDLQKALSLEEQIKEQVKVIEDKDNELMKLSEEVSNYKHLAGEWARAKKRLEADNEKLSKIIQSKLFEKL